MIDVGSAKDYLATCGLGGSKFLLARAVVDGTHVSFVTPAPATGGASYVLSLTFDSAGAKAFDAAAAELYQETQSLDGSGQMAIVADGLVVAAPVVNAELGSNIQLDGMTQQDAATMAGLIQSQPSELLFRPVVELSAA